MIRSCDWCDEQYCTECANNDNYCCEDCENEHILELSQDLAWKRQQRAIDRARAEGVD